MKILVFTGGGIAPALNATLYGVITAAQRRGWRIFGGLYGWASLLPGGKIVDLSHMDVRAIQKQGGSFLRSSRTNPLKDAATTKAVVAMIKKNRYDGIIPIGGDDTLGAAHHLATHNHIPIVGVPKTIDNDLGHTYFTPGFPTAAATVARYTDAIRQAAYGARRIFVIEVMGGAAGWLAAASALGGADVILPPEQPITLSLVLTRTRNAYRKNGSYAVVVVSHQAKIGSLQSTYALQRDAYGIRRAHLVSVPLRDAIEKATRIETLLALPANVVSSSDPIPLDQRCGELLGRRAIALLADGSSDAMVAIDSRFRPVMIPLARAVAKRYYRHLTARDFDFERLLPRATALRYLQRITGITLQKEKPYTRFLKMFIKKAGSL